MKTSPSRTTSANAFSLFELLAAVVVLAVLVALVFPVLGEFRKRSQSSECVINLRNLSAAFSIYRSERNQRLWDLRSVSDGGEGGLAPANIFYRYGVVKHGKEMRCPAATNAQQGAWTTGGTGSDEYVNNIANQYVSYAVSSMAFYINSAWKMNISINSLSFFLGHEAQTPLFMDGLVYGLNASSWQPEMRFTRMALRHNGRANVLFLDGHVESLDRQEVLRLDPYGGRNPSWIADFGVK